MTLSEFKAWFEGFTEDMDGAPSKKQFERIKEKVAQITGTPITQTVIREYYDRYRPWWNGPLVTYGGGGGAAMSRGGGGGSGNEIISMEYAATREEAFERSLYGIGKAEFKSIAA